MSKQFLITIGAIVLLFLLWAILTFHLLSHVDL